jgi:hypothetical protein
VTSVFNRKCADKDQNYSHIAAGIANFSDSSYANCIEFNQSVLPMAIVLMLLNIFFLYFFEIVLVSPHKVKYTDLTGSLGKIQKSSFFFPILNVYLLFEKLFFMNKTLLILKFALRVIILLYYMIKIKKSKRVTNYKMEIYVESFCAVSVFLELIYFYFIYDIKELQMLNLIFNPAEYSIFYSKNFLFLKFVIQILLSYYIGEIFFNRELASAANFYGKMNSLYDSSNSLYTMQNLIYFINNYEKFDKKSKEKFVLNFLFFLNKHQDKEKCLDPHCECYIVFKNFKQINFFSVGNKSGNKHIKPKFNYLKEIYGIEETRENYLGTNFENFKIEEMQNKNLNNSLLIIENESKNKNLILRASQILEKNAEKENAYKENNFSNGFSNMKNSQKEAFSNSEITSKGSTASNLTTSKTDIEQDLKMKLMFMSVLLNFLKHSSKKSKGNHAKLAIEYNFLDILVTVFLKKNYLTGLYN